VLWTMRTTPTTIAGAPQTGQGRGGGGGGFGGGRGGRGGGPAISSFGGSTPANAGDYTIVIRAAGKALLKKTLILEDAWFDKMF
jgi:hypothetical protein